jgi:hypothetical protein
LIGWPSTVLSTSWASFLAYMSGPITAESLEEREERLKHVVFLPEPISATGIAL